MKTIPVDLILHTLLNELHGLDAGKAPECYASAIALCIRPDRVAEEWNSPSEDARWILRCLDPDDLAGSATISPVDRRTV